MSDSKFMQLSNSKKSTELQIDKPRGSYQSLDKVDKKHLGSSIYLTHIELHTSLPHKKNYVLFKSTQQEKTPEKGKGGHEEWPPSNKRRYLKNYQLPKIGSPLKMRKE